MMMGSEKGSVLVIVITGITIIAAIGAGVASMVNSSARTGVDQSLSVQALYTAESGLEWAYFQLGEAEDWQTYCEENSFDGEIKPNIGQAFFTIAESSLYPDEDSPEGCKVFITGWVGQDENHPLASRRLEGTIPNPENGGGGDSVKDIFNNLEGWTGAQNVSYENGLEFDVTVKEKKDTVSVKLNRKGSSEIVDENSFDENSDVYFFVKIDNWEKVASLKIGHKNSWEGNCDPISECQASEESDIFSVLLENISKENVNDSNVSLDVVFQESGTVTFEWGCIASTIDSCTKTVSQNPVGTWNEG